MSDEHSIPYPHRKVRDSGRRDAIPARELNDAKPDRAAELPPNLNGIPKNVT